MAYALSVYDYSLRTAEPYTPPIIYTYTIIGRGFDSILLSAVFLVLYSY